MPKYAMIAGKVPQGEHFDESAIVNEGGWMTVAHLDAIEVALAEAAVSADNVIATNNTIGEHVATIATLNTTIETLEATNTTSTERISALEAEIAVLNRKPSGQGTIIPVSTDPIVTTITGKSAASDPESTLNIAALDYIERKRNRAK